MVAKARTSSASKRPSSSCGADAGASSKRSKKFDQRMVEAATKIASWFKDNIDNSNKNIAERFRSSAGPPPLSIIRSKNLNFDKLHQHVSKVECVDFSGKWLQRLITLVNRKRAIPLVSGTVNTKIYLSAYMIAGMSERVFEDIGELETDLIDASVLIIKIVHEIAKEIEEGKKWNDVVLTKEELPRVLCRYLCAFKKWKIEDERRAVERLRKALKEIENSIEKLMESEDDGFKESALEELEEQRIRLQNKIIPFDKGMVANADKRNRALGPARVVCTYNIPAAAATGTGSDSLDDNDDGAAATNTGMSNEQLAHELLLNGNFQLEDDCHLYNFYQPNAAVYNTITDSFDRAFWASVEEELKLVPPCLTSFFGILSDIKERVIGFSLAYPEALGIKEIIDVEHIKAQVKQDAFTLESCKNLFYGIFGVIINLHGKMDATARMNKTIELWGEWKDKMEASAPNESAKRISEALHLILDRIHKIRVDIANVKIRKLAPVIRVSGINYEKANFTKSLVSGALTLERTEAWISKTVDFIMQSSEPFVALERPVEIKSLDDKNYKKILFVALVNLVADCNGRKKKDIPETLLLDQRRIRLLHAHFHIHVVSTVILTQVYMDIVKSVSDKTRAQEILQAVAKIIAVEQPPKNPLNPKPTIDRVMDEISVHLPNPEQTRTLIDKHVEPTNVVYKIMVQNFKKLWYHRLAGISDYALRIPECARCIEKESVKHIRLMDNILLVSVRVHIQRYNDILGKVLGN